MLARSGRAQQALIDGPSAAERVIGSLARPRSGSMRRKLMVADKGKICVADVDRYRIAQLFHELSHDFEKSAVVRLLSRRHDLTPDDVLAFAAEFPKEPLWRL